MKYRVWYSTEAFADYIINNTDLKNHEIIKKKMHESDANNPKNFHVMPDHIKKILYLDAPDLIVEMNHEPIFSVEVSTEAGTGHNVFQRFARLAASVENNVPAFYIYPEAVIIKRKNSIRWDRINHLIYKALKNVMYIYKIPALFYYFPSRFRENLDDLSKITNGGLLFDQEIEYAGSPSSADTQMNNMFLVMNEIIKTFNEEGVIEGRKKLLGKKLIRSHIDYMDNEYFAKGGDDSETKSPLSATVQIPTQYLINYLENKNHEIGELLRSRAETILYKVNAKFRGDPYPGCLAAIDYLLCREGTTFEERKYNLVLVWADVEIDNANQTIKLVGNKGKVDDFISAVKNSEDKNILSKDYAILKNQKTIPRYYMQVRYGSTYSKVKHIRVFSYFADAILFLDGEFWRDA